MFRFFRKNKKVDKAKTDYNFDFDFELTASVLAYEVARSDGNISENELNLLHTEISNLAVSLDKDEKKIFKIIEQFSSNSVSFYEFIEDINNNYSKKDKLKLLSFLWDIAYADKVLEVNEERLVRRIANLIMIKDVEVLRLKYLSSQNK